jgi:hypothetical protein
VQVKNDELFSLLKQRKLKYVSSDGEKCDEMHEDSCRLLRSRARSYQLESVLRNNPQLKIPYWIFLAILAGLVE